jgi:ribosomal protein S27AE
MIVRCTECNAAYAVDDEKVQNKKFGFSCPKCGTNVIIDNRGQAEQHDHPEETMEPAGFDFDDDAALSVEMGETETGEETSPGEPEEDLFMGDELQMDVPESVEVEREDTAEPAIEEGVLEEGLEEDFDLSEDILAEDKPADMSAEESAFTIEDESELPVADAGVEDVSDEELQALEDIEGLDLEPQSETGLDERVSFESDDEIKTDEVFSKESEEMDESLTIDLDSLDIQLAEDEKKTGQGAEEEMTGVADEELDFETVEPAGPSSEEDEEDLDLTLDLDSLDLPLDEIEEVQPGEEVEEDERLTLEDAGLTIDELVESTPAMEEEEEEEELRLTIDEIDPNLTIDNIHQELTDEESAQLLEDTSEIDIDELPEIDLDEFDRDAYSMEPLEEPGLSLQSRGQTGEEYLDLETGREFSGFEPVTLTEEETDMVPGGVTSFSIDYALSFSRPGGVLRLSGLYMLSLIPHLIVFAVYSLLSSILGFINWIMILFSGYGMEDFMDIQKKTIRYFLYICANLSGVVEDRPMFTGRRNIDHSMQYDVIYPAKPSRFLALLRISGIGIVLAALPHILLLMVLSLGLIVIAVAGIISVIATRRWPNLLFDFMVRYYRYSSTVLSFTFGLVDRYPSFRFG